MSDDDEPVGLNSRAIMYDYLKHLRRFASFRSAAWQRLPTRSLADRRGW